MLNHPAAKESNLVRISKKRGYVMQHKATDIHKYTSIRNELVSFWRRIIIFTPKLKKHSIMANHLNTNKQFMVGNGILAFAVIFVVVIFIYMSMRMQQEKHEVKQYTEVYAIHLMKGFAGDSISIFINDSLIMSKQIAEEPIKVEVARFAEQSALLIVDNRTEAVSTFDLSEKGGTYQFEKEADGVKQLAQ